MWDFQHTQLKEECQVEVNLETKGSIELFSKSEEDILLIR